MPDNLGPLSTLVILPLCFIDEQAFIDFNQSKNE